MMTCRMEARTSSSIRSSLWDISRCCWCAVLRSWMVFLFKSRGLIHEIGNFTGPKMAPSACREGSCSGSMIWVLMTPISAPGVAPACQC